MGRPPLAIGTYGKIRYERTAAGWRARTQFRDFDGVTREVERSGRTQGLASRRLKDALRERTLPAAAGTLTGDSRFREAADLWVAELTAAIEAGTRSPTTLETYQQRLKGIVLPALAEVRVRELTTPRLNAVVAATRERHSAASAKTVRTILSGVCGLAVRFGALPSNPVRDISRIEGRKKASRSLTIDELRDLLAKLDADEIAARHDLPDLARWYAGTGERTGEALAVHWHHIDLDTATVTWGGGLIRVKGQGQRINHGKTEVSARPLRLPSWVVEMLRLRQVMLAKRYNVPVDELDGPIFPNSHGGLRDKHNTIARWRDFRERAGYPWVTFRTFRRSVATILDEAGLSAREIADQLGHSKVSTTQDVYMGRRMPSRRAADALDAIRPYEPKPGENQGEDLSDNET
jgi:integrase